MSRPRLPKKILVGPVSYEVRVTEPAKDGSGDLGGCQYVPPVIEVRSDQTELQLGMTLLHEALHAVSSHYGLDLKEKTIRVLELSITSLLRDNPRLSSLLLGEDVR